MKCLLTPVTPEVAGSSPVAPVENILQIGIFGCLFWRNRPPAFQPVTPSSRTRIRDAVRSCKALQFAMFRGRGRGQSLPVIPRRSRTRMPSSTAERRWLSCPTVAFSCLRAHPAIYAAAALPLFGCCCGEARGTPTVTEAPGRCTVHVGPRILAGVATIAHWDDLERERAEVGPLCSYWTDLSTPAGSKTVRLNRIEVDPGKRSTPLHVENEEEEIFYVLRGSGLSWQREGKADVTYEVRAGDCLIHLGGEEAHTLVAGPDGLDVLAFGFGADPVLTYVPRLKAMRVGPARSTWTGATSGRSRPGSATRIFRRRARDLRGSSTSTTSSLRRRSGERSATRFGSSAGPRARFGQDSTTRSPERASSTVRRIATRPRKNSSSFSTARERVSSGTRSSPSAGVTRSPGLPEHAFRMPSAAERRRRVRKFDPAANTHLSRQGWILVAWVQRSQG